MQIDPDPAESTPDPPPRFQVMELPVRVHEEMSGKVHSGITSLFLDPFQTHVAGLLGEGVRVGVGVTRGVGGLMGIEPAKQFLIIGALEQTAFVERRSFFVQYSQAAFRHDSGCWLIQRSVKQ